MTQAKVPTASAEPTAAEEWQAFARRIAEIGAHVHDVADRGRSPRQQPEINEGLILMLCMGILFERQLDPDRPEWVPWMNHAFRQSVSNADNCYHLTRIRGSGTYRMAGNRGSASRVEIQVWDGFYGFANAGPVLQTFDLDQFRIEHDSDYEIIFSPVRPEGHTGHWVELDPQVEDTFLFLRNITYDWATEELGYFTIQNLRPDKSLMKPRYPEGEFGAISTGFLERMAKIHLDILEDQQFISTPVNLIEDCSARFAGQNVLGGQSYSGGRLHTAPDEAAIIEFAALDPSIYWLVQLLDSYGNALDYMNYQTSLNHRSARIDSDGRIRLVVSDKDPGVPNWLDKSGAQGDCWVRVRAYKASVPDISVTLMPLADLRRHLPADVPSVSPEQRLEAMLDRAASVQRRRRW